ncbi:unnamed protein product (macronuclear) [Paramecium tetraurelia]|uniref:Uncharacterized protein n=1 Tax=Paramecium tetraurelia TaxID=5888 RepID=A0E624_PARTE|nr:uncharacterized protein GSPATT00003604001 [Paramecium tetraurelia]CAK90741.1 unnamed protein product [Paramecium tetraurelia]|eukprot:XP_001458138.1 hypothetical protein (macronuclear) [Paramecium tetraurelia strain d4-2]
MSLTSRFLYQRNKQSFHYQKYQDRNHYNDNTNEFSKLYVNKIVQKLPPINEDKRHQSRSFRYDTQINQPSNINIHALESIKPKQKLKPKISHPTEQELRLSLLIRKVTNQEIKVMGQKNQSQRSGLINEKQDKPLTLDNLSNQIYQKKLRSTKKYFEDPPQKTEPTEPFICGWLQLNNDES